MHPNTARLFNAIVILGASLVAGCSSSSGNSTSDNKGDSGNSNPPGGPQFKVQADASPSDAGWTGW
jgi:hypothetical protein